MKATICWQASPCPPYGLRAKNQGGDRDQRSYASAGPGRRHLSIKNCLPKELARRQRLQGRHANKGRLVSQEMAPRPNPQPAPPRPRSQKVEAARFRDKAAAEPVATRTTSGLVFQELRGPAPARSPALPGRGHIHYTGSLVYGEVGLLKPRAGAGMAEMSLQEVFPGCRRCN